MIAYGWTAGIPWISDILFLFGHSPLQQQLPQEILGFVIAGASPVLKPLGGQLLLRGMTQLDNV